MNDCDPANSIPAVAPNPPTTGRPNAIRPPRQAVIRAPGLLPMLYTPSELAEALGLTAPTIRDWLGRGLPHERDDGGRLWINGRACAAWLEQARRPAQPRPMAAGEAYCFRCRRPVKPENPVCRINGKVTRWSGLCPACGTAVHRGARRG